MDSVPPSDHPPPARKQIRMRPQTRFLPTGALPRLQDGTIVVNYVGTFSPSALQVFTDLGQHVRGMKFSRKANDEMRLYAEIGPDIGYERLQVLLGAVRTLAALGMVNGLTADKQPE